MNSSLNRAIAQRVIRKLGSGSDSIARLAALTDAKTPALAYYLILFHLFKELGQEIDEERIVKSATGIRNTVVWRKLFKFQRDGAVAAQPKTDMLAFYQGWIECIEAMQAGQTTGHYTLARDPTARREALAAYARLVREIARLRARAEREPQVSRRVELNLTIRRFEAELEEAKERL